MFVTSFQKNNLKKPEKIGSVGRTKRTEEEDNDRSRQEKLTPGERKTRVRISAKNCDSDSFCHCLQT